MIQIFTTLQPSACKANTLPMQPLEVRAVLLKILCPSPPHFNTLPSFDPSHPLPSHPMLANHPSLILHVFQTIFCFPQNHYTIALSIGSPPFFLQL